MKKLLSMVIVFTMVLSMIPFGAFAAEEVILAESFEGDFSSTWSYKNDYAKSNITVESDGSDGKKSVLFNDDSETASPQIITKQMAMQPGTIVNISADFKVIEGNNVAVYFRFLDKGGKTLAGSGSITIKSTTWKSASKTATAPEGTVNFVVLVTGTVAGKGKCYVDNIKVAKTGTGAAPSGTASSSSSASSSASSSSASSSSSSQPVVVTGDSIIDESFEGDFSSQWTYKNEYAKSNITVENDASDGKKSLLFNDDSEAASPNLSSKMITMEPGTVVSISADFKVAEGKTIAAYFRFYDKGNKVLPGSGSITINSKTWKNVTKSATAPSGTVAFQVLLTGSVAGTGKCYIDNVKVIKTGKEEVAAEPEEVPVETTVDPLPQASGNVVLAESFEGEKATWKLSGISDSTTATVVTKDAYDGKKSIYVADDSSTGTPGVIFPRIQCKEGDGFEVKAFIKHDIGALMKIWYRFYDQEGKRIASANFGASGSGWIEATKLAYAPEGAASLEILLTCASSSIASAYIDRLTVTKLSDEEAEKNRPVTLDKPEVIEGIPASSDKFHIYLCLGQSNMVGADPVKNEDIVKVNGAYLLNGDSKWEVAQPYTLASSEYLGYNRYSTVGGGTGKTGPTIGFARGMVKKVPEGVKIGIISNAKGGTSIDEWSKGYEGKEDLDLYEKAVSRTKEALAKGGVLKGIFWFQGESCAAYPGYMDKLTKIASGLREELGVQSADVPFFVTEVPYVRAGAVKTLQTAPQFIDNCYVISCEGLTIFDSIHLDAVSQRKLGLRYAEMALSKVYGITASADDMFKEIYGEVKQEVKPDDTVYTIMVNGQKLESDVPPTMAGDRLFVPIRVIFETLGATVSWDDPTQTVTGVRGDRTVIMQIGDEHMTVNGVRSKMGVAPMLKDSRTLVPIRFVGEGLGAEVGWDEKTNTASITLK